MLTADAQELREILENERQAGWLTIVRRWGKSFRHGSLVVTCEPEVVQALLMDKTHTERRSEVMRLLRKVPGADGILFRDGEDWMMRLRATMPTFQRAHVDGFAARMHAIAAARAEGWGDVRRVPDLYEEVLAVGLDVALRVGYGLDPATATARRLGEALVAYKRETARSEPRWRLDDLGEVGLRKLRHAPWIAVGLATLARRMRAVERAVDAVLAEATPADGWLTGLVGAGMPRAELALEANHLYGAFNAIDYVLTCGLLELGRRPPLVAELRAEWARVLGGRTPERRDFPSLPVTTGFLREVVRLYPVTMTAIRRVGAPLRVGGETLPVGADVGILLYPLHRHPDFWKDGAALDPARWSTGEPAPFTYTPFLDGPRKCIGRHLAELHFVTTLHAVASRFDIAVEEVGPLRLQRFALPRFEGPLPVTVRRVARAAA